MLWPAPVTAWTVGGQPVDGSASTVSIEIATGRTITVGVALDAEGSWLTCTNVPDEGAFEVPVIATVSEAERSQPDGLRSAAVDGRGDRDTDRLAKLRLDVLINRVRHANPALAGELQHLVALRYGTVTR